MCLVRLAGNICYELVSYSQTLLELCSISTMPGHTWIVTSQIPQEFGWLDFMHPPYSSDLAPSDDYLFLSMANNFVGEKFASKEDL